MRLMDLNTQIHRDSQMPSVFVVTVTDPIKAAEINSRLNTHPLETDFKSRGPTTFRFRRQHLDFVTEVMLRKFEPNRVRR